MKIFLLITSVLLAGRAFAFTQLVCNVSEDVNPPLQMRSTSFVISANLSSGDASARINLASTSLGLNYSVETFLSQLTSPGQQAILIYIKDTATNQDSTTDGHGFTSVDFDAVKGSLHVQCAVQ